MAIDLGKQMGPLPLGAWIVVVGAGVGIALYTRQSNPTQVVEDTSMDEGVGEGPGWVAVPPPTYGPVGPQPATNEEWGRNAINHLIGMGYPSATADSAIRRYLAAEQLSVTEYALITEALRNLGAPPVPLPPGAGVPTEPTTPASSNDTVTTITSAKERRFGQSLVVRVSVRWVVPAGRRHPNGHVTIMADDVQRARVAVVNGSGIAVLSNFKGMESLRDRRWVIRARFWGAGTARNSSSTPIVVTFK